MKAERLAMLRSVMAVVDRVGAVPGAVSGAAVLLIKRTGARKLHSIPVVLDVAVPLGAGWRGKTAYCGPLAHPFHYELTIASCPLPDL